MKKIYFTLIALLASINMFAQGWPANYSGVMLQGFSWDSYDYSQWTVLEKQADDMKGFIDLVWLPQSGKCIETTQVMGYKPYYYFNQNSSFGTEAELRSLIAKFKANGIGAIADVVVNHRNTDGWYTFPAETYKGVTYQMSSTDICKMMMVEVRQYRQKKTGLASAITMMREPTLEDAVILTIRARTYRRLSRHI